MRTSSGMSTEAVFIFHNMLRKLMTSFKPDYIAAIFESSEPTIRSETYAEYKANRSEMPQDLGSADPVRPTDSGGDEYSDAGVYRLRGG